MKNIINGSLFPIKNWASVLDPKTEEQALNIANLPFIFSHVALMPDAHKGIGSTVGSVIATKGAVIPAAVGVDIGCGMSAIQLPVRIESLDNLRQLRHSIEKAIPIGKGENRDLSGRVKESLNSLGYPPSLSESDRLVKSAAHQLGSLGGGNHFIEICKDKENGTWIMLHSGSRHIGNELAMKYIGNAKNLLKEKQLELSDRNLAYFTEGSPEFKAYIDDINWAQKYAKFNRQEMLLRIIKEISVHIYNDDRLIEQLPFLFAIDCHHNFCQKEEHFGESVWVTRKGAVSAQKNEYGIIPGSMGTKSYIVRGLGNPDSFHSCSHGAGRKMSRTEARKQFTKLDLEVQTEGIECKKDDSVIDEIPGAYKDIDQVMQDQSDLVEIVHELKQVICIKGG